MEKVFLHFKSDTKFNLYINGEYVNICESWDSIDVAMKCSSMSYMFCPISDKNSYYMDNGIIEYDGKNVTCHSSSVKIINYGSRQYDIVFVTKSMSIMSQYNILSQNIVDGCRVSIYNNSCGYIMLTCDSCNTTTAIKQCILDASVSKVGDYIAVCSVLEDNSRHVLVASLKDGSKIIDQTCSSLEQSDVEIKTLTDLNNINGEAQVVSFNFASGNLDKYIVYLRKNRIISEPKLIPYAFLSSVKSGNVTLAKKYLSGDFADITENQLQSYFGKVKNLYYNAYSGGKAINYVIEGDKYHSFDFVISNGKIQDIKEKIV